MAWIDKHREDHVWGEVIQSLLVAGCLDMVPEVIRRALNSGTTKNTIRGYVRPLQLSSGFTRRMQEDALAGKCDA
jgi:hypothetical protein